MPGPPVTDAFFRPKGDNRYEATPHTSGPWAPNLQHAGPPAALIGREIERTEPRDDLVLSRITFDILHAVPVAELTVSARVARPGRSVELIEASLEANGREVVSARAWRVRKAPAETPATPPAYDLPPLPGEEAPMPDQLQSGYLRAIEWRPVHGGFLEPGPAAAWTRLRHPLVEGEEPTGLQRVLAVADSGNGISGLLDMREWWFINPELTLHLDREPVGEWICLDAATSMQPGGAGLAASIMSDERGPVARGMQTLYVGRR